ncbi:unnamed protein product, partial [Prorocentrum cordatum]
EQEQHQMPSTGSLDHTHGSCKPCLFFAQAECRKGSDCTFCHFQHDSRDLKRVRPSKKTRSWLMERGRQLQLVGDHPPAEQAQPGRGSRAQPLGFHQRVEPARPLPGAPQQGQGAERFFAAPRWLAAAGPPAAACPGLRALAERAQPPPAEGPWALVGELAPITAVSL